MRDNWTIFSFLRRHDSNCAGVLHSSTTRCMSVIQNNTLTTKPSLSVSRGVLAGQGPGLNRGPPDWRPGH